MIVTLQTFPVISDDVSGAIYKKRSGASGESITLEDGAAAMPGTDVAAACATKTAQRRPRNEDCAKAFDFLAARDLPETLGGQVPDYSSAALAPINDAACVDPLVGLTQG